MASSLALPPMRRACFLSGVAILAASFASAQAISSFSPGLNESASGESSSSFFPSGAGDGAGAPALLPSAPGGGSGGAAAGQYGGGSGGGRGRFSHIAFEAGGGFNTPVGNDGPVLTWGGNFTVGGGLHFSKRFALLAEYQFIDDKLPGTLIADAGAQGGHAHIWSLTLDPVIDLFPTRTNSAYLTGGGGFYRKVTSFTDPEEVYVCYYFCGIGVENVVVSHFSSNQGGVNFGMGFTHRLGGTYGDGNAKLFAEVRYVFINTPSATSTSYGLGTTEVLPVTVGLRW